ncbi:antibiotic biosynthesis monooxygenase [Rhizobium sp. 3T7]|uniref:putative quinol monooxygenase n=1 Tax=Rhizobium sp. 3T7 TaxID=2874922 RepID=UPI001CCD1F39|nr:putative quinol monooxygenase [Rhizobium sp. 3T7]MBZ9792026.1 antibiotic biosynthesis monooxygenase [Rhizobium sp. 3T7]
MTKPYKFIVTIELVPGTRDEILARAPEVQLAARADNGCLSFDCFICTDDPNRLVFIESWTDEPAYAAHLLRGHTQRFLEFYEPFHRSFSFETITANT